MSARHFQVIVIGSGFAGSLTAMIACRLGLSTALIERGRHPRFAIGESSTPLANLLLEEIAEDYDLPSVRPLCKWGTWQKQTPQIACGLKRGFTFYHHEFDRPFAPDPDRRRQLLVGASPNEEIADMHWYRPDFDRYLACQSEEVGAAFWDEVEMTAAVEETNGMHLSGKRRGEPIEFTAEFVIDATGPRGFLHRALGLRGKPFAGFPATQALFSHFENVATLPVCFCADGDQAPYPQEQAAVHHVFPGGWIWVLKFNNGITSAGVAATDSVAKSLNFEARENGWQKLLERLPSIAEIFRPARATMPFVHHPRIAFQSEVIAGSGWAMLPSAAGVIDPLLSTGFPLTLLGIQRIARLLELHWRRPSFVAGLGHYAGVTALELATTAELVAALYATMDRFELFRELSLLYFAAASFSETVRRLRKPHLADSFLLCRHPIFSKQVRQICEAARQPLSAGEIKRLKSRIREAIEPIDVAGFTDRSRHPWYPAKPSDLFRNAAKVGAEDSEISAMLARSGLNKMFASGCVAGRETI